MTPRLGGELAALAGAALWAVASLIYRQAGERIPPAELNLVKGALAIVLLALTALALGDPLASLGPPALGLLALSGAVGIGVGDTAFFQALNDLGARRALLIGTLAPPTAGLLAWLALGEALHGAAWLGIGVTVAGVAWVVTEREPARGEPASPGRVPRGVAAALLAALAQAAGLVLSRAALTQAGVSPLWSAVLRLAAGEAVLVLWLAAGRQRAGGWLRGKGRGGLWARLAVAISLGTYLALWLQQLALQRAPAGVVQTLFATSPLFVLPLAAATGERVSARSVVGVAVALGGVALLFGAG